MKKETRQLVRGDHRRGRLAHVRGSHRLFLCPPDAQRLSVVSLSCFCRELGLACSTTGGAVSIIKDFTCEFTPRLLKIASASNGEKSQGHFASSLWPLVVSGLNPGVHTGYPGSIPEQGAKISLSLGPPTLLSPRS